MDRLVIVDGYVDEPTCLGVPPYVATYPRYIAGAIWTHSPQTEVVLQTIDQVRLNLDDARNVWSKSDMIVLIAGMIVPGKYLGGTPISVREAKTFFSDSRLQHIPLLLVGPWARFGCGLEGGKLALSSEVLSPPFTHIVRGDPEVVIGDLAQQDWALLSIDMERVRESASEVEEYTVRGARILPQYPGHSHGHLICEIESYRGCPRFFTGGCAFCTEPLYGVPQMREPEDIIHEVQMLYETGARAFRIGRQADIFTYRSTEMGEEEFPLPNPAAIEKLFSGIRRVAPDLDVLHIDNVNPGTIAHHPDESREVAKSIITHHTSGDVAAFGIESLDPEVRKRNNLKVSADEALTAVRVLNEVGSSRPEWGLPHLLPGLNFIYGLPGERKQTMEYNMQFLQQILDECLMVRRINIRQVIGFPNTRIAEHKSTGLTHKQFIRHKQEIREKIDVPMLERVAPLGTVIRSAIVEQDRGNSLLLRPLGTYPILCQMPGSSGKYGECMDVFVTAHGPRSVSVLPYPFRPKSASLGQLRAIPGFGAKRAARVKTSRDLSSVEDMEAAVETELPQWFTRTLRFR